MVISSVYNANYEILRRQPYQYLQNVLSQNYFNAKHRRLIGQSISEYVTNTNTDSRALNTT